MKKFQKRIGMLTTRIISVQFLMVHRNPAFMVVFVAFDKQILHQQVSATSCRHRVATVNDKYNKPHHSVPK